MAPLSDAARLTRSWMYRANAACKNNQVLGEKVVGPWNDARATLA